MKQKQKSRASVPTPEAYIEFHEMGFTSGNRRKGIVLSEFRWLTPKQIAAWAFFAPLAHRFVPFAATPSGDTYCFWWDSKVTMPKGRWAMQPEPTAIVLSPHDSEEAEIVCENWDQFIPWALLNEARSTDLPNQLGLKKADVAPLLLDYMDRLGVYFLSPLANDTLRPLFSRAAKAGKPGKSERGVITAKQYEQAVKEVVRFKRRGETLVQYAE
jgi:hypothetical protein